MLEWLLFIASGGHWGPRTRSLYCSSIKWSVFCGIHDKCECIEFGLKPYLVERWADRYMLAFMSWSDCPSVRPPIRLSGGVCQRPSTHSSSIGLACMFAMSCCHYYLILNRLFICFICIFSPAPRPAHKRCEVLENLLVFFC